ncbi:MAG TPA: hypothetical protein VII38_18710 [Polyangia bacterium]
MSGLVERAAERGLGQIAAAVERYPEPAIFEPEVPPDARLTAAPSDDPLERIGQLARRGLDPAVIPSVLRWLGARRLERALVAWDVLSGSLLPLGDPLVGELNACLGALPDLFPARSAPGRPGIDLHRTSAAQLIARYAKRAELEQASTVELLVAVHDFDLAAIAELQRRGDPLPRRPGTVASLRALAAALHLAHLPTLASLYLDFLVRALGERASALELCETLFDAGAPERIPGDAIRKGDLPERELRDAAEYLVYRSWHALGEGEKARALMVENGIGGPRELGPDDARVRLVRAHLDALAGQRALPVAWVARSAAQAPLWRYAQRVRLVVTAAAAPPASPRPLELLHGYVSAFGSDRAVWSESLQVAPQAAGWRKRSVHLLGREARALPHEPSLWLTLAQVACTDRAALDRARAELDERLRAQSARRHLQSIS